MVRESSLATYFFSVKNYHRFGGGEVGAEDALGLGVEVVGAVAEVVGEA